MAKILILGGGFGGVIAAQQLAEELGDEHQITMVSRSRNFVFYPALVRLAFGKCSREDVSFDLRGTMLNRRVNFIEAEVARIDPDQRKVIIAHGEVEGSLSYDYLLFALGRRLATERVSGFFENSHHLLNVDKALKFGQAIASFKKGHAIIGQCPGARLPVPVFETAFSLSRLLQERGDKDRARITIISPDPPGAIFNDYQISSAILSAMHAHEINYIADFPVSEIAPGAILTDSGRALNFNLLMLVPPFEGSAAVAYLGLTNNTYINVDATMRVAGAERIYAAGDCVNFSGPKMGHMAVRQALVAAANMAAEIQGRTPAATYSHEMRLVIDEGGPDSVYIHKDIWTNEPASVRQGRFWSWAKRAQEKYWEARHA